MPNHVNIFNRKPLATAVPSKRYEPWISVFERLVSEAQEKVKALSKQEKLYIIIKEFLELQGLPNEVRINVGEKYISVWINALPTNTKAQIEDFNNRFCEMLFNHSVRSSKDTPNIEWGGPDWDADCRYSIVDGKSIIVSWRIPLSGIADLEVKIIRREVTQYETTYQLVPRVKRTDK